jgi:succinyl-CoA synthetase alpha subunit
MFEKLSSNPAVMVQGITGTHGAFHTQAMLQAGTHIVSGVTPGKGGQKIYDIPVYGTVAESQRVHPAEISIVFVPAPYALAAITEAINGGIKIVVCITEGIPVHDTLTALRLAQEKGVQIIGPNCPGVLMPGITKLGIIPNTVGSAGNVALVSRSGTLTYEAAASLTAAGIGQRIIVGIGGDPLIGTSFVDCLKAFEKDTAVDRIVLIGEIGGQDEQLAADYIKSHVTKPVYAYVVGHSAPPQTKLGHAGAIMGGESESAGAKTQAFNAAGAITAVSLPDLIVKIVQA